MIAPSRCRVCGVSAAKADGMTVWMERVIRRALGICWTCIEEAADEIARERGEKRYAVTLNEDGLVAGIEEVAAPIETAQPPARGDAAT